MKVTVMKYLNVRVGSPSVNAPCYQYLAPGSELEIDGQLYEGDFFEGINTWMKDGAGNYYWSGGVEEKQVGILEKTNFPTWMTNLRIPEIWTKTTGHNVGVAVIDTGIKSGINDLPYNDQQYYVYKNGTSPDDNDGHGTHCAGLIGARSSTGHTFGVAPDCKLFACKISDGQSLAEKETIRYAHAIQWCAENDNIHIVSISWGSFIEDKKIRDEIQKAIDFAVLMKNKIIICAIGNASKFPDKTNLYPACFNNTITTGVIPVPKKIYPYVNEHLAVVTAGFEIESFWKDAKIVKLSGTSQANAIIAGIIALKIQQTNFAYDYWSMKEFLVDVSHNIVFKGTNLKSIEGTLLLNNFFKRG